MKRTRVAAAFVIVAIALNIFCAIWINDVFDELKHALEGASVDMRAGDAQSASKKLEDFDETLERNERGLILFIRRELVYDIAENAATLKSYANVEHREDFCAEAARALETLRTVREAMFTLS